MAELNTISLPGSGLAEDILAHFVDKAQAEATQVAAFDRSGQAEIFHLVTFQLGKEEYGIEIASVQEIIRAADITPVPGAPQQVRGVINLRGKIIPVIDLRTRFALPPADDGDSRRIVVVELGQKRIGMLVDSVSQVMKIPAGVVEELPEEATCIDGNYIRGVGKLDSRLIVILDLTRSLLLT